MHVSIPIDESEKEIETLTKLQEKYGWSSSEVYTKAIHLLDYVDSKAYTRFVGFQAVPGRGKIKVVDYLNVENKNVFPTEDLNLG